MYHQIRAAAAARSPSSCWTSKTTVSMSADVSPVVAATCTSTPTATCDPCVFIHYSDSNIRQKTLLEALCSPLFTRLSRRPALQRQHAAPLSHAGEPGKAAGDRPQVQRPSQRCDRPGERRRTCAPSATTTPRTGPPPPTSSGAAPTTAAPAASRQLPRSNSPQGGMT